MTKAYRLFRIACPIAVLAVSGLLPVPARADFFDNARRVIKTDIPHFFTSDVPHFFQDDVPCAFGGHPTSHTRTSCDSPSPAAEQATDKSGDAAPPPPNDTNAAGSTPPNPNRY